MQLISKKLIAVAVLCAAGLAGTAASADSCYWMSNTAGNPWLPAPQGNVDRQECYQLDSCDGGQSASGGGCYKWAASADAPRQSWFSCFWMSNTAGNPWLPAPQGNVSKSTCYQLDSCDGGQGASGGGCYKWSAGADAPRQPWK